MTDILITSVHGTVVCKPFVVNKDTDVVNDNDVSDLPIPNEEDIE